MGLKWTQIDLSLRNIIDTFAQELFTPTFKKPKNSKSLSKIDSITWIKSAESNNQDFLGGNKQFFGEIQSLLCDFLFIFLWVHKIWRFIYISSTLSFRNIWMNLATFQNYKSKLLNFDTILTQIDGSFWLPFGILLEFFSQYLFWKCCQNIIFAEIIQHFQKNLSSFHQNICLILIQVLYKYFFFVSERFYANFWWCFFRWLWYRL